MELKRSGQMGHGKRLEDALGISAVPSEVLGETRLALESLESAHFVDQVEYNIKLSLEDLNRIL